MNQSDVRFTVGQRVTYSVPPGAFGGSHRALELGGEVIVAAYERELAFRPDRCHYRELFGIGFDEEDMHYNGLPLGAVCEELGIRVGAV